jgi:hypothetical protein
MNADKRGWKVWALIWVWPYPLGWAVWLLIYCSNVDLGGGESADAVFWWSEAVFVMIFLGTATALPVTGVTAVWQFMRHVKRRMLHLKQADSGPP